MQLRLKTFRLAIITSIAVIVRFVFHILLGRRFGVSWELDCLFVGFTLFGLSGLANEYFTSLFIPVFNDVRRDNAEESLIFVDVIIKWSVLLSVIVIIFVRLFDLWVIKIIAPGFSEESILLARRLIHILVFALLFFNVQKVLIFTLNALHYYAIPASIRLLTPVVNIGSLFVLVPFYGVSGIAIGNLFSNILGTLLLLVFFHSKTNWLPSLRFYHKKLPELINKSAKMSLNTIVWGFRDIIIKNFASRLGEGAITLFSYAEKIINTLIQISINSIVRVYYSRVSEWISFSKWQKVKDLFIRTTRVSMALSFMLTSLTIVFLPSLLKILFLGSKFTFSDIKLLSELFNVLLIYFIVLSFETYLSRVIIAAKKIGIVAINTVTGVLTLYVLLTLLFNRYGIYSLPFSFMLSQLIVCIEYYFFTRKLITLNFFELVSRFSKGFLCALSFLFFGLVIRKVFPNDNIIILGILPVWLGFYYIVAKRFLREERKIILAK
ncbi:MAG: polysaccharide biosynthesis C-terminal domain-containing protein [Candidatus Omnitrophica bacterium]|nr:polysaccharide biosynthesis C-terminal domain-containing protein [Candidatus Omnitrophota bacterium]